MKSNDVTLIQRSLAGDDSAFKNLMDEHRDGVYAHALRKTQNSEVAEDIVQDTFLRVHTELSTLKDHTAFRTWLYKITANLCYAWLRKQQKEAKALATIYHQEVDRDAYSRYVATKQACIATEAQREVVKIILAQLKAKDREIILFHYFQGLPTSEIGTRLGVSENTIKSQLRRLKQRLRKKYGSMIQEALDITTE